MKTLQQLDLNKKYTYADYLQWPFTETIELIRGKVFRMAPVPNLRHQEVSANLVFLLKSYLQGQSCSVFHAPFDVRLPSPQQETKNN